MTFKMEPWYYVVQAEEDINTFQYYSTCPYWRTGVQPCDRGCWDEPRCITQAPGSPDSIAEDVRRALPRITGHGRIKHARDVMRRAERLAIQ